MPRRYSYPENLLSALHLNEETQRTISYDVLTDDQRKGLEYAMSALSEREQIVLREHFVEGIGYKAVGLHYNLSENRTRNIIRDALRWLRKNAAWLYYITDGYEARTAYLQKQLQTEERMYCERCGITSPMHLYYQGLDALHLPVKLHNPLRRNDIKTVRELLIFLCSSAHIRNFGALSKAAVQERLTHENLLPVGELLPCCNAEAPRLDLEVQVFGALNTHS